MAELYARYKGASTGSWDIESGETHAANEGAQQTFCGLQVGTAQTGWFHQGRVPSPTSKRLSCPQCRNSTKWRR